MNNSPITQAKHDLLVLLAELQKEGSRELLITPEGDKLKAVVRLKGGNRSIMTITLDIPLINEENALPLFSKVEWCETAEVIQQRMPVKYLIQSQRPRDKTHLYGNSPKMRRSQRNPLSKAKKNPRLVGRIKRAKTQKERQKIAKEHFEENYQPGEMTFLQEGKLSNQ